MYICLLGTKPSFEKAYGSRTKSNDSGHERACPDRVRTSDHCRYSLEGIFKGIEGLFSHKVFHILPLFTPFEFNEER